MSNIAKTHFTWEEALRNSGYQKCPFKLRGNVVKHAKQMEKLRAAINVERSKHGYGLTGLSVISWLRSPAKNDAVGGARQSRHLKGDACDIAKEEVKRIFPWKGGVESFDDIANRIFTKGGFGTYAAGNRHVDSRGYRARWSWWSR